MTAKNKTRLKREEFLVEARQRQLTTPPVGSLRSHGKLWGMDVFSWFKPSLGELENTLSSFPGPICWYANEAEILDLIKEDQQALKNIHMVCSYDRAGFSLPNKVIDHLNVVLGAAEITDALELLKSFKNQHQVLLFTSSSANWKNDHQNFEAFLQKNQ